MTDCNNENVVSAGLHMEGVALGSALRLYNYFSNPGENTDINEP